MTTPRLRISHVVAQPVLVWDDGEELTPGPQLEAITLPLSKMGQLIDTLPGEVAALQEHLLKQQEAPVTKDGAVLEVDGFSVYPTNSEPAYAVAWGGQWLSGCYGSTPEEALTAGRKEVGK